MTLNLILLITGLLLIVFGADWLVDGASAIARKAGVSEFIIGLTIVGFGTSCPELVVSLNGAFQGNADISIGNVIGSNIFNTMLILGLTAIFSPIAVTRQNRMRDIPINLLVTFLMVGCGLSFTLAGIGNDDSLTRTEGIVFLIVFAAYMYYSFKSEKGISADEEDNSEAVKPWKAAALIILGLGSLVVGGRVFVDSAVAIARNIGVSDKFIAITILAGGTSLPELATCIVAAAKKKDQLALGNILGSNLFNILLILGCSACVTPLSFGDISMVDIIALISSIVMVWLWTYTGKRDQIDRWEGAILTAAFIAYYIWLFIKL